MKEKRECSICGSVHPVEALTELDGDWLCGSCLHGETVRCQRCGERIWRDDNAGDGSTPLCQRCYDRYYTSCVDCGRVILQDDAYYIDEDDYDARCYGCHCRHGDRRVIRDYCYKPAPVFYGEGERYWGVELEVDDGGEAHSNAARILAVANSNEELVYIKYDGSLNEGFEIVSHPMTKDFHMHKMPWAEIMNEAKRMGYRSHQSGTCGLHFHVNRSAFGETEEAQEAVIARILYFFEKHWPELLRFSRRTQAQLQQWANRYGLKEHPQEILKHAKGNQERYTCVNLTNYHTLEFRMIRGTLRLSSFRAALQLLDRICDVALAFTDEEIKNMSWTSFVAGCGDLPELVQYLKERRLYINEPVVAEMEGTLESMQAFVGGAIQAIYPYEDPVALVCHGEGKLLGLEYNRALRDETGAVYDILCGPFFVCGLGEEDFADLPEDLMDKYWQRFRRPELFVTIGGNMVIMQA